MKYAALGAYLRGRTENTEVTVGFDEIENIIGAKLPASATKYRE